MLVPIVPAYKPDEKLLSVIESLRPDYAEIIVVNDGSGPSFEGVFAQLEGVHLLAHEQNRGKGAALKTAMRYCAERWPEALGCITIDADGQHRAPDVAKVAAEFRSHPHCLVLGVRSFTRAGIPLRSRVGNIVTRMLFFALVGRFIRDTQTGLRAIPMAFFAELVELKPDRYEYELEVLLACRKKPLRQVTIETVYIEENRSSHFSPIQDSLKIYTTLIRCRWRSFLRWSGLSGS